MKTWKTAVSTYLKPSVGMVLLLGFSCGLPLSLVFGSLSYWLKTSGVALAAIGYFSLVRTPYSLKFLWAPLVDRIPVPGLSRKFGQRRSWALVFQIGLIACVWALSLLHPAQHLGLTAVLACGVAFFSASQDIVVDALRIDSLSKDEQGPGAGAYQLGYRIGMLASGAGGLWLASVTSWNTAYQVVGCLIFVGLITVLCMKEQTADQPKALRGAWFQEMLIRPLKDFMKHNGWFWILLFVVLYKINNAVLGVMAGPFYLETGFSEKEIAAVSNMWGSAATIFGTLMGGVIVVRFGVMRCLWVLGFIEILTSLGYAGQAAVGYDLTYLIGLITFDNIVGGMGNTVFVAYLSLLCSKKYTTTQYALLSSLAMVARDVFASNGGVLAAHLGWIHFFILTGILMLPGLILLYYMRRRFGDVA